MSPRTYRTPSDELLDLLPGVLSIPECDALIRPCAMDIGVSAIRNEAVSTFRDELEAEAFFLVDQAIQQLETNQIDRKTIRGTDLFYDAALAGTSTSTDGSGLSSSSLRRLLKVVLDAGTTQPSSDVNSQPSNSPNRVGLQSGGREFRIGQGFIDAVDYYLNTHARVVIPVACKAALHADRVTLLDRDIRFASHVHGMDLF